MIIYNKYVNFFISRGASDDLFIKLVDKDLNSISGWLSFRNKYNNKDLKTATKLIKSILKQKMNLNKILEI
jgi:hypothetical protein